MTSLSTRYETRRVDNSIWCLCRNFKFWTTFFLVFADISKFGTKYPILYYFILYLILFALYKINFYKVCGYCIIGWVVVFRITNNFDVSLVPSSASGV